MMTGHEQTLKNIKSDVLSLLMDNELGFSDFYQYVKILDSCLEKYFDITNSTFLKFESELLLPIRKNVQDHIIQDAISWVMIEPYFFQSAIVPKPVLLKNYQHYDAITHAIALKKEAKKPNGVLLIQSTSKWEAFASSQYLQEFLLLITNLMYKIDQLSNEKTNEQQYRKLFQITDLFHSTMDVDVILENMLMALQQHIPHLQIELILSNDQDRELTLNIKLFDYASERPATIEAFVSGELTFEHATDLKRRILNAPIKGRQAIYGILQISGPEGYVFSGREKEYIRMLADASGNALENAKLYRQSHRLISDLQLINETSHRLNLKMDLNEMFVFLKDQLKKSFQPDQICFMFKDGNNFSVKESTELFHTSDADPYIHYINQQFSFSKDPIFIADFNRQMNEPVTYNSIMAAPILIEEKIQGYCMVLHKDPYYFPFDSFKLMQSLIHHSSLAMANTMLQNKLQEMVDRDHLTKLYARSYLDKYVEQVLTDTPTGMFLLIDIDNFKRVNDTYGHQIGDEVLIQIANKLKEMVADRGICARWGGEELAVCMANIDAKKARKIAQQFVETMPVVTNPQVTISVGLITWDVNEQQIFKSIFSQADDALYVAKNSGKNRFVVYGEHENIAVSH